ncbi:hypothetical protein ACQ4M4_14295 [Leptolyngbya sp. AN02str]|uniref:hypothetical protein n=1 Tax=Leptolyngbya sp. AN02str TaxID=3423363 RepID=UPI003D3143D8
MPRRLNRKCVACAELSVEDAIALHGDEGDGCWEPSKCHRRRSHYRHRDDNNRRRRRQGLAVKDGLLPSPTAYGAVLLLVRDGADQPIHAIGVEIWQGNQKIEAIAAQHTIGMRSRDIQTYLQELLGKLTESYGIAKFDPPPKEIPISQCPIPACPHTHE